MCTLEVVRGAKEEDKEKEGWCDVCEGVVEFTLDSTLRNSNTS